MCGTSGNSSPRLVDAYNHEPMQRTLISKLIFTVFAAIASFGGALLTEAVALQFGLPFPGLIVWDWLHPDPQSASMGSMLSTFVVTDSVCWFIFLMVAGFLVNRPEKKNPDPSPR